MIIVDKALEKRESENNPVRVAIVGAGYMGRGIARQLLKPVTGMRLVAMVNRTISEAERAFDGASGIVTCDSAQAATEAIEAGRPVISSDPSVVTTAGPVDVVIEATGEIEYGAAVVLSAIEHGKHVVLMNAELDATLGPILKVRADSAGVVITNTDGDEPGVAMNLLRFVKTIGYEPLCVGNIKGMIDRYRTPATQKAFAEKYNQKPILITSFADGTKLSMEATVLGNAAGFGVAQRGMIGHKCSHVKETLDRFTMEMLSDGGIVDYTIGAEPHTGAFVLAYDEDPVNMQYMNYFKMGDGPLYCFYTPYHLPHLQILPTIGRAALFNDATVAPIGAPRCEVITVAKTDLKAGEVLDGIGGFHTYGMIENASESTRGDFLPMGLSQGCRLKHDMTKDRPLTRDDVELPEGRLADRLRAEQDERFREAVLAATT